MATKKEINQVYQQYFNKDFPATTLSKWRKEGKIGYNLIPKEQRVGAEKYDYNIDDFIKIITDKNYKPPAKKEKPQDAVGEVRGYLLIKGIVPQEEKEDNYKGTMMYCKCLKCNREDLIQVRFSYLTKNGNYHQDTCGCGRKEQAFLATTNIEITEEFTKQFEDFEKYLFVHKMITKNTDKYYTDVERYKEAVIFFYNDTQFNNVYNFWLNTKRENTFYDLAKPSLDHITPRSRGGDNTLKNLQVLTVFENLNKRDMTQEEWEDFKTTTNTHSEYYIESIMKGGKDYEK